MVPALITASVMGAGLGVAEKSRRLARGVKPRGSGRRHRGTVCRQDFRVGAWSGDGSVAVETRQLRRKAERVAAKRAGIERRAERSRALLRASREFDLSHDGTPLGAIDVARREMGREQRATQRAVR